MADPVAPHSTRLAAVAQVLGHAFQDADLLRLGLTHASRLGAQASARDRTQRSNERLEFLGDAVAGGALCHLLYERFPDIDEAAMARLKANLASRQVMARRLDELGLTPLGLVGPQMGTGPEQWPDSVKANLAEGILGAIYLDAGWPALLEATRRFIGPLLDDPAQAVTDPRQRLQEWALAHTQQLPRYESQRSGGTDHVPEFTATVTVDGRSATATGTSRRKAEAEAATAWLAPVAVAPPG